MAGFTFSEKQEGEISRILAKYPLKKSAMLPLLTLVQMILLRVQMRNIKMRSVV